MNSDLPLRWYPESRLFGLNIRSFLGNRLRINMDFIRPYNGQFLRHRIVLFNTFPVSLLHQFDLFTGIQFIWSKQKHGVPSEKAACDNGRWSCWNQSQPTICSYSTGIGNKAWVPEPFNQRSGTGRELHVLVDWRQHWPGTIPRDIGLHGEQWCALLHVHACMPKDWIPGKGIKSFNPELEQST